MQSKQGVINTSVVLKHLMQEKIVAVIRGIGREYIDSTIEALLSGGIVFIEVTLNTDDAIRSIARLSERYGDTLRIGAGTVLDVTDAKEAIAAGAQYIVAPNLDEEVLDYGLQQGIDVWPGALTPTEIAKAFKLGASAVKVFPLGTLGVSYLKEIHAPLGHIPMMVTGGVNLSTVCEFLEAGAFAVGIGGNLVDKDLVHQGKYIELENLSRQYVNLVQGVRNG